MTGNEAAQLEASSAQLIQMSRAGIAMSGLFAQWLRGLTINSHERLALAHLWEHGPMTMSELGMRIPLSRGAITALTDRLEAIGYVQRTADEHDRRRTVLVLTSRPFELVRVLAGQLDAAVREFEADFSADELAVVDRWLSGLRGLAHQQADALRARSEDELPNESR